MSTYQNVWGCSVCFSPDKSDPANKALRAAVVFLLVVVTAILIFFGRFFFKLLKKETLQLR